MTVESNFINRWVFYAVVRPSDPYKRWQVNLVTSNNGLHLLRPRGSPTKYTVIGPTRWLSAHYWVLRTPHRVIPYLNNRFLSIGSELNDEKLNSPNSGVTRLEELALSMPTWTVLILWRRLRLSQCNTMQSHHAYRANADDIWWYLVSVFVF